MTLLPYQKPRTPPVQISYNFNEAAGRRIQSAAVIAYASAGDFPRFNPHLHGLFLEGGFAREGQFVHLPIDSNYYSLPLGRMARTEAPHNQARGTS